VISDRLVERVVEQGGYSDADRVEISTMNNFLYNDPEEWIESEPAAATVAIAAAAAQRAVQQDIGPLPQAYLNGAQQNEALVNAQVESAFYEADRALAANYPDWVESRDAIIH
jgi:hypothetical protein